MCRFTQEGGVSVRLSFEVADTGTGIASEEVGSLFDAFVQGKSGGKSQEGTGLGLPISQKFVQMMGGDIAVESKIGSGTIFRFGIQANLAEDTTLGNIQTERHVIALTPDQPPCRILITDDRQGCSISHKTLII